MIILRKYFVSVLFEVFLGQLMLASHSFIALGIEVELGAVLLIPLTPHLLLDHFILLLLDPVDAVLNLAHKLQVLSGEVLSKLWLILFIALIYTIMATGRCASSSI